MDPTILEDRRPQRASTGPAASASDVATIRVAIEYCGPGNHEKVARSLADALREEFPELPMKVDLVASSGGAFEVRVNERLVHSKKATFRFPSPDEVFYHVRAVASGFDRETASS
jgi:selT/selW/selH-like putative selenoprotein